MAARIVFEGKGDLHQFFAKSSIFTINNKHVNIIHIVDTRPLLRFGTPTGERAFITGWMSQLYDRDAGVGLGLYMPVRNAGVRLALLGQPLPDRRGKT